MNLPNRHSIRLKGYDYSQQGCYFVTICANNRQMLFGSVGVGRDRPDQSEMVLNKFGKIVDRIIQSLPKRFAMNVDIYQIMPNHIHLIIVIVGAHHDAPVTHHDAPELGRAIHESPLQQKRSLLSQIVGFLKMNSSRSIHKINGSQNVWQRNFYEHVIRNETELIKIREYIKTNPAMWDRDRNNPELLKSV